ncbi:MAG TPA: ABC transporter permease, partial [Anaeromyxobacter sp.]
MTRLLDTIAMALGTLRANPLRSLLTLLGIVIGASTVIAMMSLTEGLRVKMVSDFAMLGAGAFQLQKWPALQFGPGDRRKYDRRPDLTREQGEALRALPHVAHVSIEEWSFPPETLSTRERATKPTIDVCGGNPDFIHANAYGVGSGRFISEVDVQLGRRVA